MHRQMDVKVAWWRAEPESVAHSALSEVLNNDTPPEPAASYFKITELNEKSRNYTKLINNLVRILVLDRRNMV